jgi:hypothetical protein
MNEIEEAISRWTKQNLKLQERRFTIMDYVLNQCGFEREELTFVYTAKGHSILWPKKLIKHLPKSFYAKTLNDTEFLKEESEDE